MSETCIECGRDLSEGGGESTLKDGFCKQCGNETVVEQLRGELAPAETA